MPVTFMSRTFQEFFLHPTVRFTNLVNALSFQVLAALSQLARVPREQTTNSTKPHNVVPNIIFSLLICNLIDVVNEALRLIETEALCSTNYIYL